MKMPEVWDVEGPIQAELFVVWLNGDRLELTGPCGAAPWLIELGETEHPVQAVDRIVRDVVGAPRLVHSTSWRRDRGAVVLSFVVVIDSELRDAMASEPIDRAELARSGATAAPSAIDDRQVLEHGLRHLAWLAQDDPIVARELSPAWRKALSGYVPEPFRGMGGGAAMTNRDPRGVRLRCACGWETDGSEEEVIAATEEHGRRVHNMQPTRDEIRAMYLPDDPVSA
jgi:hypothetical protein